VIINICRRPTIILITISVIIFPKIVFAIDPEHSPVLVDNEHSAPTPITTELIEQSTFPPASKNTKTLIIDDLKSGHAVKTVNEIESSPPFLLVDDEFPDQNTGSIEVIEGDESIPAILKRTNVVGTNDTDDLRENKTDFDPPFLLIDDVPGIQNTISVDLSQFPIIIKGTLNDEIISDDDFMDEDMYVATSIARPPFFSFLDNHQKTFSNYLHLTVLGVDNFFATNKAVHESTGSHLRLTLEANWPEGEGTEFKGGISLRARFPGLKEKYKLVIESDPIEQKSPLELESRQRNSAANDNGGLFTGIEKKSTFYGWKVRPSIGVKLRSPLDLYTRLRIDRNIFFDQWLLYLFEGLYWFDSSGFGFDSVMRWDRPINRTLLYRTTSLVRYTDLTDIYQLSQTAEIIHVMNSKSAITYKVGVFGDTENRLHTTTYLTSLLFRFNIHSDYLFLDLQPQILFEKENNFESRHEFFMRLEFYYRD